MKLYLIHCGFYDTDLCDGLYESHVNFFVAANSFEDARMQAKMIPEFKAKRMHVDGLQEVSAVNGHRVQLQEDLTLQGETIILNHKHRDLAPKSPTSGEQLVQGATMSKSLCFLVLFCSLLSCVHAKSSWLSTYEHESHPQEEPGYETFAVSTEMEIGKAWPILKEAPAGAFISVGAERSFRGASMAERTTELIVIDVSPRVIRFTQINRQLLKTKTLAQYRSLRFDAPVSEWISAGLTQDDFSWWDENVRHFDNKPFPYAEMFNRFETDTFYQRFKRKGSDPQESDWWKKLTTKEYGCYANWDHDPGLVFDFASIVDFKTGNYLFDEALYEKLHRLAIHDKIHAVYLNLSDLDTVKNFVDSLYKDGSRIAVLDLDNANLDNFLGDDRYKKTVNQFLAAGQSNSILLVMVNYARVACSRFQTYVGFQFDFVKDWPKDFGLTSYEKALPKVILPLMNGKLYSSSTLPPYWSSFDQIKPSVDSKSKIY